MKEAIEIYTDGSYDRDSGCGGWATVEVRGTAARLRDMGTGTATSSQEMEMKALIEALRSVDPDQEVTIYTDQKNGVDHIRAMREGMQIPRKSETEGRQTIEKIVAIAKNRPKAKIEWIRSHSGNPGNEWANRAARRAMRQAKKDLLEYAPDPEKLLQGGRKTLEIKDGIILDAYCNQVRTIGTHVFLVICNDKVFWEETGTAHIRAISDLYVEAAIRAMEWTGPTGEFQIYSTAKGTGFHRMLYRWCPIWSRNGWTNTEDGSPLRNAERIQEMWKLKIQRPFIQWKYIPMGQKERWAYHAGHVARHAYRNIPEEDRLQSERLQSGRDIQAAQEAREAKIEPEDGISI